MLDAHTTLGGAKAEGDMGGKLMEHAGNTDAAHPHGYDPPSLWQEQPVVWIPDDELGLAKIEEQKIRAGKVRSSNALKRLPSHLHACCHSG